MCLQATVCLAVTSLPAPLAIKGLARNRQDVRLTDPGRSCEKSAASDHWPVNRCSQWDSQKPPGFYLTYLKLCSEDERSFYRVGTTCG